MSDYVHRKAVRVPFPKEILEKCNTKDPYDCENYLKEILAELWNCQKNTHVFELGYSDIAYYIDWVYYYTYGETSGDFGTARYLTDNELNTIKPYFDKLNINYKNEDLRVVEYCYYNCCDPPDYYEVVHQDDSGLFIENHQK